MKYRCRAHGITLEVEGDVRRVRGLSWAGSPQCALLTMKEVRRGRHGECEVEEEVE